MKCSNSQEGGQREQRGHKQDKTRTKARTRTRQEQTGGSGLRRHMAEPELKQRGSRESVAKAASQEKMEGR